MNSNVSILGRAAISVALVAGAAAQAQVPSDPYNYSRTSAFTYYAASDGAVAGLLKSESVEPDNAQSCVLTTYSYDAYGNKVSSATANCAGASGRAAFTNRTSTTTYSVQTLTVKGVSVSTVAGVFATSSANALNQSETKNYDPRFGVMVNLTGPNALTTTWAVDDFGRKVKELRADGTSTVSAYCVLASSNLNTAANSNAANGDPLTCPSPASGEAPGDAVMFVHTEPRDANGSKSGPFVRVYTDRLGRELRTVTESFDGAAQPSARSGALIAKDTLYNTFGAKTYLSQPYFLASVSSTTGGASDVGVTRIDFDVLGRPIAIYVSDANGSQSNVSFGNFGSRQASRQTIAYAGLATTTTNDKGQTRQEEKNAIGEVVRVTDAVGAQVAHQRDAFGNLLTTKDALQNQIAFVYDIRGRKTQMSDPDAGLWSYDYDALGQLVWQQGPNQTASTATVIAYDRLGRMTSRTDPEYTSTWSYDTYADSSACAKGVGKLCESNTSNGVNRKIVYDAFGRPINSRITVSGGPAFATAVSYDAATGRVANQTYPTGVQVTYLYTGRGFLEKLALQTAATVNPLPNSSGQTASSASWAAGSILWQAKVVNAWGRTEQQAFGNGVTAQAVYESATGRVTDLTAGSSGATTVLNQHYTWDSLSNLTGRIDNNGDTDLSTGVSTGAVSETFTYADSLNRLTNYTVSAPQIAGLSRTVNLQYNVLGMLLYKSDVGNYSYPTQGAGSVRPHALQSVAASSTTTYTYDSAGNLISASGGKYRTVSYTSFNLPDSQSGAQGPGGSPKYVWQYDESHARIKEARTDSSGTRTTWYLHPDNEGGLGFESETGSTGTVSNRHYLTAGSIAVGVLVSTGALPSLAAGQTAPMVLSSVTLVKVEFWHKDHLGSLVTTTDHLGNVTQRYAYDPFGKRRYANGNYDEFGNIVVDWSNSLNWGTDRGFTGHEELDDLGLVHMNGRIFDPTLGMFLQADPMMQDATNLQNYNRYGYCFSNPLTCTDPSGFLFGVDDLAYAFAVIATARAVGLIDTRMLRSLLSIAVAAYLGPTGTGALFGNSIASAATAGFVSGALASGNLQGALQGAFGAGLFYGAGNLIQGGNFFSGGGTGPSWAPAGIAVHAVVGCITSAASGGKCGPSALSAAFSYAATPLTDKLDSPAAGVSISYIIGGTASKLAGGKFTNGAVTAAFGYLFNHISHWKAMENAVADTWRAAGYTVQQGVQVVLKARPGELDIVGVADYIAVKDGEVIVGEVKDGLGARLTKFQRALAGDATALERLAIVSDARAADLGLEAGTTLAKQLSAGARLSFVLDASFGSRAAGQAGRLGVTAMGTRVLLGALRVLGSVGVTLMTLEGNVGQ